MGSGEEDHRDKVSFSSHLINEATISFFVFNFKATEEFSLFLFSSSLPLSNLALSHFNLHIRAKCTFFFKGNKACSPLATLPPPIHPTALRTRYTETSLVLRRRAVIWSLPISPDLFQLLPCPTLPQPCCSSDQPAPIIQHSYPAITAEGLTDNTQCTLRLQGTVHTSMKQK